MKRDSKFIATKNYTKDDGTYTVAKISLTLEQEAIVLAVKHYIMVLLHKKGEVGNLIPTYIEVVGDHETRAWTQLPERAKWRVNYRIITEFYRVHDILENEEDTSYFTLPEYKREEFVVRCGRLSEEQQAEVTEFLKTLEDFRE